VVADVGDPWTRWLPDLLWPGARVWVGRGDPPASLREGLAFAVLPNARDPRHLVPLGFGRAAAAPFLATNESLGAVGRARRAALAAVMATGAGRLAARDRVLVLGDEPLRTSLERFVGERVSYAVQLGADDRLNAKPVLRVLDGRRETAGFVKVPRGPLTAALVENEVGVLERWGAGEPSSFAVPRILGRFALAGARVALMSALPQPFVRWAKPVPVEVFREIAELDGVAEETIGSSAYATSLAERLDDGPPDIRRALERVLREAGGRPLRFGFWHGDLAPWNVAWAGDRLMVWDWERAGGPVPIGFDVLHHRIAPGLAARDAEAFVRGSVAAASPLLRELGVDASDHGVLATLPVLERCARVREAERAGRVGPRSWPFARAALAAVGAG
jgi:hypothetical protein